MKKIICCICNTNLYKNIHINISDYHKHCQNLKTIISHDFYLKENMFSLQNLPSKEQLNDVNKEYKLYINIHNPSPNIIFQFDNNDQILLKNCNNKDFNGIIRQFDQQGIFFSEFCIHNSLRFTVWGIEIPQKNFLFSCIPEGTLIRVENVIPLNYKHLKFVFGENEIVKEANKFIKSKFKDCCLCAIASALDYKLIPYMKKLNKNWNYYIICKQFFCFMIHFQKDYQTLDHFITVSDMKLLFSLALCVKPEEIIFYDKQNNKVNGNCFLIDIINDKGRIEFDIYCEGHQIQYDQLNIGFNKYKINKQGNQHDKFKNYHQQHDKMDGQINQQKKFEDNVKDPKKIKDDHNQQNIIKYDHNQQNLFINENDQQQNDKNHKISPNINKNVSSKRYIIIKFIFEQNAEITFKKSYSTDTKISEIAEFIAQTYQIADKVEIKYEMDKTKIIIDKEMIIDDVHDEIRQKSDSGKYENVLYIGIRQRNKPKMEEKGKDKKIKNAKNEDNDTEFQNELKKPKDAKTKFKPEQIFYDDDDDDDDKEKVKKSPNKNKEEIKKIKHKKQISDNDDDDEKYKKSPNKKYKQKEDNNDNDDDSDSNEKHKKSPNRNKEKNKKYKQKEDNNDNDDDDFDIKRKRSKSPDLNKDEEKAKSTSKTTNIKYYYQTNRDPNIYELNLNSEAKVITMKKAIADKNGIDNLANIKILFAGKDLLDDIVLKSLKIGLTILFVYIRSQEDILLMTANALRVSRNHI